MKKFLLTVMAFLLLCSLAGAEEIVSSDIKRDKSGNIIDMKSPEGLRIIYVGTFRNDHEANIASQDEVQLQDEGIFSVFMVKSDKDTPLQLDVRDGYDTRTNKFSWRNSQPWGYIADIETNGTPRDILETFWVRVTFWHDLPFKYGTRPVIARIGFVINGNELSFKRIRPGTWEDWKKIEPKILELEENEQEEDFQPEELDQLKAQ